MSVIVAYQPMLFEDPLSSPQLHVRNAAGGIDILSPARAGEADLDELVEKLGRLL